MNVLSLYTGIGGIDYSAHWAGMETVAFCEPDEFCQSVLRRHWPAVPIFNFDTDVTKESLRAKGIGRVDLVVGGPPCQPHSFAGKQLHEADERYRWPEMARIVEEIRPSFVLVENVAGFGRVAECAVRPDLARLGYETVRFDIPACSVAAPHKRERLFVVAMGNPAVVGMEGDGPEGIEVAEVSARARLSRRAGGGDHRRSVESRLGRAIDGISSRLDSARWPAPRGCEQFDFEEPRVTTIRELRRKRLKAIGNAVVPLQVYPILALIYALWESEC